MRPTTRIELTRRPKNQPQKDTFLILHDPGMAEYLAWVGRLLEHVHADLQPIDEGESISAAIARVSAHRREANEKNAAFDQAWLALDGSARPEEAGVSGERRPAKLAIARPSFEHWLLLHFEEAPETTPSTVVAARLVEHIPGYDGSLRRRENALYGKYETARSRELSIGRDNPFSGLIDAVRLSQHGFKGGPAPKL